MPNFTPEALESLAARVLARAGANDDMARVTARALVYADARGLPSHGVARVLQYAKHLENGRADGSARPEIIAHKAAARARRREMRARVSGMRARGRRGDRSRARMWGGLRRGHQQPSFRRRRLPSGTGRSDRDGRPRVWKFPRSDACGRRQTAAVRDQSDRGDVSATGAPTRSWSTFRCRRSRAAS